MLPKTFRDFFAFHGVADRQADETLVWNGFLEETSSLYTEGSFYLQGMVQNSRRLNWWAGRAYRFFLERGPCD